jgi:hypothetical protein
MKNSKSEQILTRVYVPHLSSLSTASLKLSLIHAVLLKSSIKQVACSWAWRQQATNEAIRLVAEELAEAKGLSASRGNYF